MHHSGTVPAPGNDCGRHHSRKAATAPGTLDERAPVWHSFGTGGEAPFGKSSICTSGVRLSTMLVFESQ
jgi:hypothetical protein